MGRTPEWCGRMDAKEHQSIFFNTVAVPPATLTSVVFRSVS